MPLIRQLDLIPDKYLSGEIENGKSISRFLLITKIF